MPNRSELARAGDRARRLYKAKGFQTAYVNGAQAAIIRRGVSWCPYPPDPRKTWRMAYRKAWLRGHASVRRG